MDVLAGRHGSGDVADWFKSRVTLALDTDRGTDDLPDELNFAFEGNLVFRVEGDSPQGGYACCKVVIGQGHTGAYNNWWIGGNGNLKTDGVGNWWLECPPVDGKTCEDTSSPEEDEYCGGVVLCSQYLEIANVFDVDLRLCPATADNDQPKLPRHR